MRDERLYQKKEASLTKERSDLIIEVDRCRNELETIRANTMATSN